MRPFFMTNFEYNLCKTNFFYFISEYLGLDITEHSKQMYKLVASGKPDVRINITQRRMGTSTFNMAYVLWKSVFNANYLCTIIYDSTLIAQNSMHALMTLVGRLENHIINGNIVLPYSTDGISSIIKNKSRTTLVINNNSKISFNWNVKGYVTATPFGSGSTCIRECTSYIGESFTRSAQFEQNIIQQYTGE